MDFFVVSFCFFLFHSHFYNRRLADEDDELSEVQPDAGNKQFINQLDIRKFTNVNDVLSISST